MTQPPQTFPVDTKMAGTPPPQSPPGYPSTTYSAPGYPQQTGTPQQSQFGVMASQQGALRGTMPLQQMPMGAMTPQMTGLPQQHSPMGMMSPRMAGLPQQQSPMGTMSPQMGGLPQQQLPLGAYPSQQVPMTMGAYPTGAFPVQQQVPMGVPLATQPLPTQAQIGQQYQAAQFAQCAYGNHARTVRYGVLGIIGAIVFFPIGLLCLFADKEDVCVRCGQRF